MDSKRLHRLSGLQTPAGTAERVQREIHVEPDDSPRRLLRHTGESRAPHIPQFLSSGHTVAVHGNTLGVLDEFEQIDMATFSQAIELKHVVPLDTREALIYEVQHRLFKRPRSLSPWMFYDDRGSRLFGRITTLSEYYPTRTERGILAHNADAIIAAVLAGTSQPLRIVELGAGTASKIGILLKAAVRAQSDVFYMLLDVSPDALDVACQRIECSYPHARRCCTGSVWRQEACFPWLPCGCWAACFTRRPILWFMWRPDWYWPPGPVV